MAGSFFSEFSLALYLQELGQEEFWRFKELLREEPLKFQLEPIPWSEIQTASKEDLAKLLDRHYPGKQAWDVTLSLFLQINREDLWTKAQEEMGNNQNIYRKHMKEKFQLIWERETCLQVPEYFYKETTREVYTKLNDAFHAEEAGPVTAVLRGNEGSGKTTLLRKVMLEWAAGNFWKDRFTFVFFFNIYEMNSTEERSLVELISRNWPECSEMIDDILSQPEKILFIMDGFEELKFNVEHDTDLSAYCRERQPTHLILRSLLQKKMLPAASLLLAFGKVSMQKNYVLLKKPVEIRLPGFSEEAIRLYFSYFFRGKDKASRALSFARENVKLLPLCRNPFVCWMICTCIKWKLQRGEDLEIAAQSTTSLYASFLTSAFQSRCDNSLPEQLGAQFKSLCALAAEGIWTQTFVFSSEHLCRNGIFPPDIRILLDMRLLHQRGDNFIFNHVYIQEFCAAVFHFLRQPTDHPSHAIGSITQLVTATVAKVKEHLVQIGVFVFGLTNKNAASILETSFGFTMSKEVRIEILRCLPGLRLSEPSERFGFRELFLGLYENHEEEFVRLALRSFDAFLVSVRKMEDLVISTFCLRRCQRLRVLRLRVKLFSHESGSELERSEKLAQWQKICSLMSTSQDFKVLHLDGCIFDDASMEVLCKALAEPTCRIQSLTCDSMSTFGTDSNFFETICRNPYLKYLDLYGSVLSVSEVKDLCRGLQHLRCKVETVVLGKCDIEDYDCEAIASVFPRGKLKHLSLIENPLSNQGVRMLCEALKHPNCALEGLMLSQCFFSPPACNFFSQALLCSKSLRLLDLGGNPLADRGLAVICEALKNPNCNLQQLWLPDCLLTSECCAILSPVLISSEKLKDLRIGKNEIQNPGVRWLCEALRHPNCKLQCLGLEACEFTAACCVDIASALITCKTLRRLNIECLPLDFNGFMMLCEALVHPECGLELLGLNRHALGEELEVLLQDVEDRKPNLTISTWAWVKEEFKLRGLRL